MFTLHLNSIPTPKFYIIFPTLLPRLPTSPLGTPPPPQTAAARLPSTRSLFVLRLASTSPASFPPAGHRASFPLPPPRRRADPGRRALSSPTPARADPARRRADPARRLANPARPRADPARRLTNPAKPRGSGEEARGSDPAARCHPPPAPRRGRLLLRPSPASRARKRWLSTWRNRVSTARRHI
jgi:hypothetical protein